MPHIRFFQNRDLPALADVWIRHWAAVGPSPQVSVATIEQAILSRNFFSHRSLLVAEVDDTPVAWCHYQADQHDESAVILCAICFTPEEGLSVCDQLLHQVEARIRETGIRKVVVGPVRDDLLGYAGLSPVGHGIGVPSQDARTSSLLSRSGYQTIGAICRMVASTSPYRMPVSREMLQLQRTTRLEHEIRMPTEIRKASAISHLDVERHRLVDHRSKQSLAEVDWWMSDPEAQVMSCAESILDLGEILDRGELRPEESFLIGATMKALSNRRVFTVETSVNQNQTTLISQLQTLQFNVSEQGQRWGKSL